MLVRPLLAAAAAAALLAGAASANDGFAGITAAGLEFGKTDAVAMVSEDLRIGIDQIRVDYVFRNESAADVSGTVAFPMPPILVGTFIHAPTIMTPGDLDKAKTRADIFRQLRDAGASFDTAKAAAGLPNLTPDQEGQQ